MVATLPPDKLFPVFRAGGDIGQVAPLKALGSVRLSHEKGRMQRKEAKDTKKTQLHLLLRAVRRQKPHRKRWKQPPSVHGRKKGAMWCSHTVGYYTALKRKEGLALATTWAKLEGSVLSEISPSRKAKYYMVPPT